MVPRTFRSRTSSRSRPSSQPGSTTTTSASPRPLQRPGRRADEQGRLHHMCSAQPDGAAATTADRSVYRDGGKIGFLLIHGLSGTPVELRYIANGLARAGHTVYCPQLAGHCSTLEALTRTTW